MKDRFMSLPLGIQLATAALGASVFRYILAFLKADGIEFVDWARWVEGGMQVVSAIATALTVTAGAAYVAHVASSAPMRRLARAALVGLWLPLLGFEVGLLAPALLSSMRSTALACASTQLVSSAASAPRCVLGDPLDVLWSAAAIAAPTFTAAVCVLAAALERRRAPHSEPEPVQSAAHTIEPAPNIAPIPLVCDHCERPFETVNALNAHRWRCKARIATQPATVSANGAH